MEAALSRQGRYQHIRDNLRVKEVRLDHDRDDAGSSATTPARPTVFAFDVAGEKIKRIWVVRDPEKLRPWTTG